MRALGISVLALILSMSASCVSAPKPCASPGPSEKHASVRIGGRRGKHSSSSGWTAGDCARAVVTPVVGLRDVVDVPLAFLGSFFVQFKDARRVDITESHFYSWDFTALAVPGYVFGIADYLLCRSLYPDFPAGRNPFKDEDETWGEFLFPNTKALWGLDNAEN